MKRKIVYISITILLVIGIIIKENTKEQQNKKSNKSIAVYIEQENGTYNKTTAIPNKDEKYILNTNKSICNGSTNLSWNNEVWGLELSNIDREETKCYLYFDIKEPTGSETILGNITVKEGTPNFSQAATTDEGVYKVSDPVYGGISYYWRGAATNNYVKFGGFCWRIVRINGDGSLRLIYDGSSCHSNGTNTAESIAVTSTAYNTSSNQSNYVGWTYEGTSQRTLSGTASNAKAQLESWYNSNIGNNSIYASRIADGKYCNDRNVQNGLTWSLNGTQFAYIGLDRLWDKYQPTLSCSNGDIYSLKVGLITADEVELAGGKNENNILYYLYNGQNYWTISPYRWSGVWTYVFSVNLYGQLSYGDVNSHYDLRPVINLKSDVTFSDGNGTLDNPYVVSD